MTAFRQLWLSVWRNVRSLPRRIYRRLAPAPLSVEQLEFIERNAGFWRTLQAEGPQAGEGGFVLVSVERHPAIQLCDASFASVVSLARGLRPLFVTTAGRRDPGTRLLQSYPRASFVYMNSWLSPILRVRALWAAVRAYAALRTPKDLLGFQSDGIRFGDVLYDAVLALKYATVDQMDGRVFQVLWRFYFLRAYILHLMECYPIKSSVFTHLIGIQGSTFSRYLLSRGIEVLNRVGSHQILIKRYRGLQDVGFYPVKPESQYFRLMVERDNGTIGQRAEEYLGRRFSQQVEHLAVALAFNADKAVYADRVAFCRAVGLHAGRPIAFVMLHAFNDYPHSHFAKPMLFQDYYVWFRRTLEIAQQTPDVNWVFKEHPAAAYYVTKDVDLHQIFASVTDTHVRFLPATADFNASSIPSLADAIITCVGTAGLEYATCGIPCILAGESQYSGLGFTIEPETPEAYEACLREIGSLPRLTAEQVVRAKLAAYFLFCVMESARYHFCPKFTDIQLSKWNADLSARLWKEVAAQFSDPDHVRKLQEQVEELSRFVLDPGWTQYVNLRQFPFLLRATGAAEVGTRAGSSAR